MAGGPTGIHGELLGIVLGSPSPPNSSSVQPPEGAGHTSVHTWASVRRPRWRGSGRGPPAAQTEYLNHRGLPRPRGPARSMGN